MPAAAPKTKPLRLLLPPWRFPKRVKSALDGELEVLSEGAVVSEWFFAALVVLGVFGEFVIAAYDPPHDSWPGRWGPAYGDLMVAFGVMGEVIAGVISHVCQSDLTRRSNDRLADSERKLAEADDRLGDMEVAAAFAQETAAKTQERAALAETRAAEANLALEKYRSPRTLSPEQQARLSNEFRRFAGQRYSFNVTSDPEPINLLRVIDRTLQASGWVRIDSQIGRQMVIEVDGKDVGIAHDANVQIGIKRDAIQGQRELGVQLTNALIREGLTTTIGFIPNLIFSDAININIGRKI